jgi:hypothetical protein
LRERPELSREDPADARRAECETALNFDEVDEAVRKELLLTLGAR